jgi:hypothetical protein
MRRRKDGCRVIEIQRIRRRCFLRNKKKYTGKKKEEEEEKRKYICIYPFRMMDGIKFIPFFLLLLLLTFFSPLVWLGYLFKAIALDGRTDSDGEMQSVPTTTTLSLSLLLCLAFVSFKYIDRSSYFFSLLTVYYKKISGTKDSCMRLDLFFFFFCLCSYQ